MYDLIASLPEHIHKALELPIQNFEPAAFQGISSIAFAGMGGSGIAGHMLKDLLDSIPIFISSSYSPPPLRERPTLAIVASYSGNTKETLEAYLALQKRRCRILGLTSGGKLLDLLHGSPHIILPPGMPPRASLPYQLFSLLGFLDRIGMPVPGLTRAAGFAESIKEEADRKARELASSLAGKFPFIYGTLASACLRFKTQLNENAKAHAKAEVFPELNHNEIAAWQRIPNFPATVVLFRDPEERQEIRASIEFLKQCLEGKAEAIEVYPRGESRLERLLYLTLVGDLASYHLAIQEGMDPVPVEYINKLKQIIKE